MRCSGDLLSFGGQRADGLSVRRSRPKHDQRRLRFLHVQFNKTGGVFDAVGELRTQRVGVGSAQIGFVCGQTGKIITSHV